MHGTSSSGLVKEAGEMGTASEGTRMLIDVVHEPNDIDGCCLGTVLKMRLCLPAIPCLAQPGPPVHLADGPFNPRSDGILLPERVGVLLRQYRSTCFVLLPWRQRQAPASSRRPRAPGTCRTDRTVLRGKPYPDHGLPPVVMGCRPEHTLASLRTACHLLLPVNREVRCSVALVLPCLPATVRLDRANECHAIGLCGHQPRSIHIPPIGQVLIRQQVPLCQVSPDDRQCGMVIGTGRRGRHLHDELWSLVVTTLGDRRVIAHTYHLAVLP